MAQEQGSSSAEQFKKTHPGAALNALGEGRYPFRYFRGFLQGFGIMRGQWLTVSRGIASSLPVLAAITLGACTTYAPVRLATPSDLSGVQTKTLGDVTVSVAILTDDRAQRHFGADLGSQGVQALWMSVLNGAPRRLWLIRNILDPDFYSADEAALLVRNEVPSSAFEQMRQYFRDESIRVLLRPGTITEGFVFLPRVEGGRYIDIRLAGDAYEAGTLDSRVHGGESVPVAGTFGELRFGFALPLPDGDFDYERLDTSRTYDGMELPDLDTDALRMALEELPCCATNNGGERNGDPLNVVIVGEGVDVLNSLSRSGWGFTHRLTPRSVGRMIGAAISGEGYPVAPVSSLHAFGRKQDFALQRARRSIAQRNHMRLWLAPFRHEGRQVWVGQVSRDIGIKLSSKSPSLTTHIIDPQVDLTREYLLHSLLAEGFVDRFGFVKGSTRAPSTQPARNLTGDPYFSDGMRLVIMLSPDPVPYDRVRSLLWEQSAAPVAEGQTEAAGRRVRPIGSEDREAR